MAISNERILGMERDVVRFRVRGSQGKGRKVVRLEAVDFMARFLLHVLPKGFKRIRHYGLLGPAHKAANLAAARAAMAVSAPEPAVVESVEAFMRRVVNIEWLACPHCREGRFGVVAGMESAATGAAMRHGFALVRSCLRLAVCADRGGTRPDGRIRGSVGWSGLCFYGGVGRLARLGRPFLHNTFASSHDVRLTSRRITLQSP